MASSTRPKPEKIHSAGKCFWEGLLCVQDEKKPYGWKAQHAYLATLDKIVYLLMYTSRPQGASNRQKPSNYWTLHKVTPDVDPRGFSTIDGANDVNHLCLQTKDPEGFQYVGLINSPSAMNIFISKVKQAMGEVKQSDQGAAGMRRANTAPPAGMRSNINPLYFVGNYGQQLVRKFDGASVAHLGADSSIAGDEVPFYMSPDELDVEEDRQANQSSSDTS